MGRARQWYRWERRRTTEYYFLWSVAIAVYGVGDFLTTIILLSVAPLALETNPLVRIVIRHSGIAGFFILKISAIIIGMYYSWQGAKEETAPLYHLPPIGMIIFGGGATVMHTLLLI
ncbi:MAG: DUF5658 family protein [Halobacteriaceae archaeon]